MKKETPAKPTPNAPSLPATPPATLEAFIRAQKQRDCPVCALPLEVRRQLGHPATERGFSRMDQLRWLREGCGAVKVTAEILNKHLSAKHDSEDDLS